MKVVILAAEEAEFKKCKEFFPEYESVLMGVGAGNVIRTCAALEPGTNVVNIGYAGSNVLPIGTVSVVSRTHRLVNGNYDFTDHANPMVLGEKGHPCHTNNDFVTSTELTEPTLFDMELNYVAAFSPRINLLFAIKIVSDNLSLDVFRNNAIRETGILTGDDVWTRVRVEFDAMMAEISEN